MTSSLFALNSSRKKITGNIIRLGEQSENYQNAGRDIWNHLVSKAFQLHIIDWVFVSTWPFHSTHFLDGSGKSLAQSLIYFVFNSETKSPFNIRPDTSNNICHYLSSFIRITQLCHYNVTNARDALFRHYFILYYRTLAQCTCF